MASTNIYTTFAVGNAADGKAVNLSKHYSRLIELSPADQGILAYTKVIPADARKLAAGLPITLVRKVRRSITQRDDFKLLTDNNKGTFAPDAILADVKTGKTFYPEGYADVVIFDNFDERFFMTSLAADETQKFIQGAVVDTRKKLLAAAVADAGSYKLYSHATSLKDSDRTVQPGASSTATFAKAIEDIKKGIRVPVALTEATLNSGSNRVELIRETADYLDTMGTLRNPKEKNYPFVYDGLNADGIIIVVGSQRAKTRLVADNLTYIQNQGSAIDQRVSGIDGMPIVVDKMLPADVEYLITTTSTLGKNQQPLASKGALGVVNQGGSVKTASGVVNLLPSQASLTSE